MSSKVPKLAGKTNQHKHEQSGAVLRIAMQQMILISCIAARPQVNRDAAPGVNKQCNTHDPVCMNELHAELHMVASVSPCQRARLKRYGENQNGIALAKPI
ncbi:MAG: hypothetical protein KKD41_07880 [Gammaproteobacteria bacterium]|nr:hypothetical protein [Gammaproteobacteria bacterium]